MRLALNLKFFLIVFLLRQSAAYLAQGDSTSVYGKLKTIRTYQVSTMKTQENDKFIYQINDKRVSEKEYLKYQAGFDSLAYCTPCIRKNYDADEHLTSEGVYYTDANCGWYKEYDSRGNLKISGHFSENKSGDWSPNSGYQFAIRTGEWIYYTDKGTPLYSEFWDNGTFLKQVPEQDQVEIWKVSFELDGKLLKNGQTIQAGDLNRMDIIPHYKNKARSDDELKVEIQIMAVGHKIIQISSNLADFKGIDLKQNLLDEHFYKEDQITYWIRVLDKKDLIGVFYPLIEVDLPEKPKVQLTNPIIKTARNTTFESDTTLTINKDLIFFLVNSLTGKRVELKEGKWVELEYEELDEDSLIIRKSVILGGYLVNLDSNSLVMDVKKHAYTIEYANGVTSTTSVNLDNYLYLDRLNLRKVYLDELVTITYQKPVKVGINGTGSLISMLSTISGLILAPIVSINFKTKEFRAKRYYTWTKLSLFSFPVGLVMIGIGSKKEYMMTLKNSENSKLYWYLESRKKT